MMLAVPQFIDDAATVGTTGLTYVASTYLHATPGITFGPQSATVLNLNVAPPRRVRLNNGNGWHDKRLRPHCVNFHPAGCTIIDESDGHPGRTIEIGIPRTFARAVLDEIGSGVTESFDPLEPRFTYDPFLVALMLRLSSLAGRSNAVDTLLADQLARVLVIHLVALAEGSASRPNEAKKLTWRQLQAVREMVDAGLEVHWDLARLAAVTGLSPTHFVRAFRVTTGQTPHQWLLRLRVERAAEMLRNDRTLTAEKIAHLCGFTDQSHLGKVLRKHLGTGPRELRRAR